MVPKNISSFFLVFSSLFLFAQKEARVNSPNGNIVLSLKANQNIPVYSISFKKIILIENSSINLDIEHWGMMQKAFISKPPVFAEVNENYKLVVGKASTAAEVGKYISIARRKNDNWWVGTITNYTAREITLNLNFLPSGKYAAEIYSDAPDADDNANHLTKQKIVVNSAASLKLKLASGGGNIILLNKLKN